MTSSTTIAVATALALAAALAPSGAAQAQTRASSRADDPAETKTPWAVSRTPHGAPDLQGYWTNNSYTPLERPDGVTKATYTRAELKDFEGRAARGESTQGTADDVHYDFGQFGLDRSQTRLTGNLRTSIIIDPPDGRLPRVTAEGQRRLAGRDAERRKQGAPYDQVQNMGVSARCVYANAGPPMLPPAYNAAYQVVQGAHYVLILIERLHEVRLIPTDGRPHAPAGVRSWLGDSRGRWEGDTLVVETTNFNEKVAFRGASENMTVIERFTRVSDDEIRYEFTVNDPSTWARPWAGELPFVKLNGPVFEHACHEGNYSAANALAAARLEEKKAAEAAAATKAGAAKD